MTPRDKIGKLIAEIEAAMDDGRHDDSKLRRARTLACEAWRVPPGTYREELLRDARELLKQGRRR